MAEPRSRVYHRNRVAETLREEIGTMLEGQLSDPRIAFCYVTEVAMNQGSKSARVYIAVDGGEAAEKETVEALVAAKGYIRHDELLGRAKKRKKSAAGAAAASDPAAVAAVIAATEPASDASSDPSASK